MKDRVLLVDDDADLLRIVQLELRREEIETATALDGQTAIRMVEAAEPAAVVLDLMLPDMSGLDVLVRLRELRPGLPVVMLTAQGDPADVVAAMKRGATDYVQKPFERLRLVTSVRNAMAQGRLAARVERLASELRAVKGAAKLLGEAPTVRKVRELIARAAASDVTVLLEGESGTGKEVAARAIHAEGARRTGPFVAVNCGAIPEGLIESELFGHEKGAFTGATAARPGRFAEADGGTIFLDEIGELRLDLQVRLLRVLQERTVQPVGGGKPRAVDVRVIAATNRDLKAEVARGAFRSDLFYRLSVFPIRMPPLRDREGDVMLLAEHFLGHFAVRHGRPIRGFTAEARRALQAYAWPGNVRELENTVERATLLEDGAEISLGSLPDELVLAAKGPASPLATAAGANGPPAGPREVIPFDDEERRIIQNALEATGWNTEEAARRLALGRATIYRKIERYGLKRPGASA